MVVEELLKLRHAWWLLAAQGAHGAACFVEAAPGETVGPLEERDELRVCPRRLGEEPCR